MKKKSLAYAIMEGLWEVGSDLLYLLPRPFETKYEWAHRLRTADPDSYRHAVTRLRKSGYIEVVEKNNEKFLHLTAAGELEMLLSKMGVDTTKKWDGNWWLFLYDIPEKSKEKRVILRSFLKSNNFFKLQASVYITPYSLNREALEYLRQTGLQPYIRILRVTEMDDDSPVQKHFKFLGRPK